MGKDKLRKILIAEDETTTRRVIVRFVEKLGFIAIQSSNGLHAWEVLQDNEDISLVITDIAMPDMDGKVLVQTMQKDSVLSRVPIIAVSGTVEQDDVDSLLEQGVSRFLSKPVDVKLLGKYIQEIFQIEHLIKSSYLKQKIQLCEL